MRNNYTGTVNLNMHLPRLWVRNSLDEYQLYQPPVFLYKFFLYSAIQILFLFILNGNSACQRASEVPIVAACKKTKKNKKPLKSSSLPFAALKV